MRKLLLIGSILLIFSSFGLSQGTDDISRVPPLNKGKLILTDGTIFDFKQLKIVNDTVVFINKNALLAKYPTDDIYKISKTGNWAALSAASAGLGWFLGAIIGTSDWDNFENLKDKKDSYIYGGTLISAVVGAAVGAMIKKDKVIFKNRNAFNLQPLVYLNLENNGGFQLACRFSINYK